MKGSLRIASLLIFTLVFASGAFAANQSTSSPNKPSAQQHKLEKASDLINMPAVSKDGKDIGKITDLAIDPATNTIAYSIVKYKNRLYPVPMSKIHRKAGVVVVALDKDKFALAPNLPGNVVPDLTNRQLTSRIDSYYGVAPYWKR